VALVNSTTDALKKSRLRDRREPGLVALYDIRPGNEAGQPRRSHEWKDWCLRALIHISQLSFLDAVNAVQLRCVEDELVSFALNVDTFTDSNVQLTARQETKATCYVYS